MTRRSTAIPVMFRDAAGALFHECLMCSRELLTPDCEYLIERTFRVYRNPFREEVIAEYALCLNCAERMRRTMSRESLERITSYFQDRVDETKMRERFLQPGVRLQDLVSGCLLTGKSIKKEEHYSLQACCRGKEMVLGLFPYALSGAALEEMNELLSAKTREVLDDFIGRYFSGPPEVAEILRRRPILL